MLWLFLKQPANCIALLLLPLGAAGATRATADAHARVSALWVFAALATVLSLTLANGGTLYQAYAQTPIGALFRFPHKFHQISSFGIALLIATGIDGLARRVRTERSALWSERS